MSVLLCRALDPQEAHREPFYFSACLVTSLIFLTSDYFATRDQSFGFLETVLKYIAWQKSYVRGFFIWRKLLAATKSIKELQEKELLQLLRLNSDTKYFKKWSLDQVQNRDDFGRLHPLVKYTHFEDDFERMIKFGEEKVICSQSPVYYAVTSGTTGKPSRIPFLPVQTQEVLDMRAVQAYKIGPVIQANKNLSRVNLLLPRLPLQRTVTLFTVIYTNQFRRHAVYGCRTD